jgi:peptide methionine sulfoxide reductase MsrA
MTRPADTSWDAIRPFWEAEPEHEDYLERYPEGYTCHFPARVGSCHAARSLAR